MFRFARPAITDPKPFWSVSLVGVVAFTFCTQGVEFFEAQTLSVNGALKSEGMALYLVAAPIFFPLFQFCGYKGQTVVLDCRKGRQISVRSTMSIRSFSILAHRQPSPASPSVADCQFLWLFGASVVQRDHGFSLINIFHSVMREIAHHNTSVKGTLPDGKDLNLLAGYLLQEKSPATFTGVVSS